MRVMIMLATASALTCGVSFAANADPITVTNTAMPANPPVVEVTSTAGHETVYEDPMQFTFHSAGPDPDPEDDTAWVFCIDEEHNITLGAQNLTYNRISLASYVASLGSGADLAMWHEIAGLVDKAFTLPVGSQADYQGAIWQTKEPGSVFTSATARLNNINAIANADYYASFANLLVYVPDWSVNKTAGDPGQIMIGQGAVPEPASWAMMLGGFGLIGSALRSQRRRTEVAFG